MTEDCQHTIILFLSAIVGPRVDFFFDLTINDGGDSSLSQSFGILSISFVFLLLLKLLSHFVIPSYWRYQRPEIFIGEVLEESLYEHRDFVLERYFAELGERELSALKVFLIKAILKLDS